MLDNRIYTFLKLCETMNYRKTAEELNMTQPAVTQHIHYLEDLYQSKLFAYSGRKLSKTEAGIKLEQYAKPIIYNEIYFRNELSNPPKKHISIGATKTIGEYEIDRLVEACVCNDALQFRFIIDNTRHLLNMLDNFELDILIVEGYFDKALYDYQLLKQQEMVGICSKDHSFAGKEVYLQDIFEEHLLIREEGSGTRLVFDNFLMEKNYSYQSFKKNSIISDFRIMESLIEKNYGIMFAYKSIAEKNEKLSVFRIKDICITHEFNFVFLKNSKAKNYIKDFMSILQA